jgi:hypothetical protein
MLDGESRAADKSDELPSPDGFARAEDYIRTKTISHFGSKIVPFVHCDVR